MGPQSSLRSLSRVFDSVQCIYYEGSKDLLRRDQPFPIDVSSIRGYTLSRISHESVWEAQFLPLDWLLISGPLYSKRNKTTKFLILAGVDADYKSVPNCCLIWSNDWLLRKSMAKTDDRYHHKAFDNLFQNGLNREAEEAIQCLTIASDWIEK